MPTYEYACTSCGRHLEVAQSFSDAPLTTCPHCGGALRKVFGSIGIVLKGSGFYKTDSRQAASGGDPRDGARERPKEGAEPAGTKSESSTNAGAGSSGSSDKTSSGSGSSGTGSSGSVSGSGSSGSGSDSGRSSGASKTAAG